MNIYFLLIRIAALLGHKKAQALVKGQGETLTTHHQALNTQRGCVWIHAASVGEFEQARPLIEKIAGKRKIVVTFFSPSGYEARKDYNKADGVYYLPFATSRNAKRFLEALRPAMAIFVKYEFWPSYLKELKKRNIPTYCISAIFRPGQRFFKWYGRPSRKLLQCFTHIYVQDEASEKLLVSRGITSCSVAGDTRFDRVFQVQQESLSSNKDLSLIASFVSG